MIFTMNSNSLELNLEASLAVPKLPSPIILVKLYLQCKVKHRLVPGKHGRGARGAAPAFDVARCGNARGTPLPARPAASCHFFFFFFFLFFSANSCRRNWDSGQFTLNRADSSCIRRNRQIPKWSIQAEIKKKTKQKKVQNTLFELNNIPYFSNSTHFIQTPSSLTLSHSVTCLSLCLCFRLSTSVSALRLPCGC